MPDYTRTEKSGRFSILWTKQHKIQLIYFQDIVKLVSIV